jgi:ribosomal peptide maturation radical SAM protein 1
MTNFVTVSELTGVSSSRPVRTIPKIKVALIYMPWGAISRGAIGVSLLKRLLKQHGHECDVHYLNIPFAKGIGFDLYSRISEASAFFPEWFFSAALFGKNGLDILENGWNSLSGSLGAQLKSELNGIAGGVEGLCENIAEEAVPQFIDSCLENIDWMEYAAVGFSVTFAQTTASLLLAARIRQRYPNVKIIFGGASTDSEMGFEILKGFKWVDYVVHGEAEKSLPQLLDNIAAGYGFIPVAGVSMRANDRLFPGYETAKPLLDLNDSPLPDYSDYFLALQEAGLDKDMRISLPFEASRGCWWGAKHHCTFCGLNGNTMSFRKKSSERVFDDLYNLSKDYRCLNFDAVDNILAMEYFSELLPKLSKSSFDFSLFFEVKANLTRRQVELLRAAGITRIQPGIESVSTRLLTLMNKGVTAIQNIQLLKFCHEFGILPAWNVLYGFPGEQPADYVHFPEIFRAISHLCPPVGTSRVIFERFSPYYFDRNKYSLILEPSPLYHLLFPASMVDLEKLAYYFNRKKDAEVKDEFEYFDPSQKFIADWQISWKRKSWFCYFEKGPDFITIYDNRPLDHESISKGRRTTLKGLVAKTYLFCGEHRSFKAIQEMLRTTASVELESRQIQVMLDQLVSGGLMFREEDRYLALAVNKRAQTTDGSLEEVSVN